MDTHRSWEIKILDRYVVFTSNGKVLRTFEFDPRNRPQVEALLERADAEALRAALGIMCMTPRLVTFLTSR